MHRQLCHATVSLPRTPTSLYSGLRSFQGISATSSITHDTISSRLLTDEPTHTLPLRPRSVPHSRPPMRYLDVSSKPRGQAHSQWGLPRSLHLGSGQAKIHMPRMGRPQTSYLHRPKLFDGTMCPDKARTAFHRTRRCSGSFSVEGPYPMETRGRHSYGQTRKANPVIAGSILWHPH